MASIFRFHHFKHTDPSVKTNTEGWEGMEGGGGGEVGESEFAKESMNSKIILSK